MLQPVSHIRLVNLIQVQILHSQTLHKLASECPRLDKQRVSPTTLHLSTLSVKDEGCQQCHRGINLNAAIGRAFRFMARPISIPIKWPFFYKKKKKLSSGNHRGQNSGFYSITSEEGPDSIFS